MASGSADHDESNDHSAPPPATSGLSGAMNATASGGERRATVAGEDKHLLFDVSDLLAYFPFNRSPTGIQRVQVELFTSLIAASSPRLSLCRFLERENRWANVPLDLFALVLEATRTGSDALDPSWLKRYADLDAASVSALAPDHGSVLVNLGSSWWLPNYFLQVRDLQVRCGAAYVPLVYDMIPALAPGYCTPTLTVEFIEWLQGLLYCSDYFLAISQATKRDLIAAAARLGFAVDPDRIGVVELDGDMRARELPGSAPPFPARLIGQQFVLLVSTIEVRKNQALALDAWRQLINRHGASRIPALVLVGKLGFQSQQILDRLKRDDTLAERVLVLSDVSDATLSQLYRRALFTVYPSSYEGWGLPVTESFCYGKVALVADNSSLVDAGGAFATFFTTGSPASFLTALEKLIFDDDHRRQEEARIADGFLPRRWEDIAREVLALIDAPTAIAHRLPDRSAPHALTGCFYPLRRNQASRLWRGMGSGEILRQGSGWYEVEPWGCRTRPSGGGLGFSFDDTVIDLALHLVGLPTLECDYVVADGRDTRLATGTVSAGVRRWVIVRVPMDNRRATLRIVGTAAEPVLIPNEDPASTDTRLVGIGLAGVFFLKPGDVGRAEFVESVTLNSLNDFNIFRRRA